MGKGLHPTHASLRARGMHGASLQWEFGGLRPCPPLPDPLSPPFSPGLFPGRLPEGQRAVLRGGSEHPRAPSHLLPTQNLPLPVPGCRAHPWPAAGPPRPPPRRHHRCHRSLRSLVPARRPQRHRRQPRTPARGTAARGAPPASHRTPRASRLLLPPLVPGQHRILRARPLRDAPGHRRLLRHPQTPPGAPDSLRLQGEPRGALSSWASTPGCVGGPACARSPGVPAGSVALVLQPGAAAQRLGGAATRHAPLPQRVPRPPGWHRGCHTSGVASQRLARHFAAAQPRGLGPPSALRSLPGQVRALHGGAGAQRAALSAPRSLGVAAREALPGRCGCGHHRATHPSLFLRCCFFLFFLLLVAGGAEAPIAAQPAERG